MNGYPYPDDPMMEGAPAPEFQGTLSEYQQMRAGQQAPMPQQGGVPDTLGGTVQTMQAAPNDDLNARFQQAMQMVSRAYAPAIKPELPEPQRPGILANILTFGVANEQHNNYLRAYNAQIRRQNAVLRGAMARDAMDLVQTQEQAKMLGGKMDMQMAGLQMRAIQTQIAQQRLALEQLKVRLGLAKTPPPTVEQMETGDAAGRPYNPQTGLWGDDVTVPPVPYRPLDPTKPMARAMDPTGTGTGGGVMGGKSAQEIADELAKRNAKRKGLETTATTEARTAVEQEKAIAPALQMIDGLIASVQRQYPAGENPVYSTSLGRAKRKIGAWWGNEDLVEIDTVAGKLPPIIRGLGGDSRISNADVEFALKMMPSLGENRERSMAKLMSIKKMLMLRSKQRPPANATTTTTTTSEPTPSTATTAPTGDVESILKKHGY